MKKLGLDNILDYYAPGWNKNLDKTLRIDGIPLSWFYQRFFCPHTLPPIHNPKLIKYIYYFNESLKLSLGRKKKLATGALFLTYPSHIDFSNKKIFRINNILKEMDNPLVLVTSPSTEKAYTAIPKLRLCKNTIYGYISENHKKKSKRIAKRLFQKWNKFKESTDVVLNSNKELKQLKKLIGFYFSKEFIYFVALYYETYKEIIRRNKIKVVVITSMNGLFERCLMAAASKLGILTLILPHGATMYSDMKQDPLLPYKFIVFSNNNRQELIRKGFSEKNIAVTGPYIFDEILKYKKKKQIKNDVVLLTAPFVEQGFLRKKEYFNYIKKIIKDIRKVSNKKITIKLHPREKYIKEYKKLIRRNHFRNIFVTQKADLYNIISGSKLAINFSSTTAIESLILDKPVITILMPNYRNPLNKLLHESKATIEVPIEEDLSKAIVIIYKKDTLKENRKKFIKRFYGNIDGKASQRIAELIKNV